MLDVAPPHEITDGILIWKNPGLERHSMAVDEDHLQEWLADLPTRNSCRREENCPTAVTMNEPEAGDIVTICDRTIGGKISGKTAEVYSS